MGVMDFRSEEEQDDDGESSDQASVSYIYVYEEGREETGKMENYLHQAYQYMKSGGVVRSTFNNWSRYDSSVHCGFSHIIVALGEIFEDGDFTRLLNFFFEADDEEEAQFYGQALAEWLQDNPEVAQSVLNEIETAEPATADD